MCFALAVCVNHGEFHDWLSLLSLLAVTVERYIDRISDPRFGIAERGKCAT
jgi:hypothetical protein